MNCQISPKLDNLDNLNKVYPWIPNSNQIRPTDDQKEKKEKDYWNANNFYDNTIDYLYDIIFNFDTSLNSNGKLISNNPDKLIKVFRPNDYPYQLNNNSNHYVLWYNCEKQPYSYDHINQDIKKELDKLFKNYQYVWYENPSMSVPEIYHVQVFFIFN